MALNEKVTELESSAEIASLCCIYMVTVCVKAMWMFPDFGIGPEPTIRSEP